MSGTVLVTGAVGFIGAQVAATLLARGERVVGLDNLNDYYDPRLKQARLVLRAALDGRNLYDPAQVRAAGLHYFGIGRGAR